MKDPVENKVVTALRKLADRLEKDEEDATILLVVSQDDPKRLSMNLRIQEGAGTENEIREFFGVRFVQ